MHLSMFEGEKYGCGILRDTFFSFPKVWSGVYFLMLSEKRLP